MTTIMSGDALPLDDPHARELSSIDEQITALLDQVRILRSKRNRVVAIARIPSELIARVFQLTQEPDSSSTCDFDRDHFKWTVVLQVSSDWRNIALNTPILWTHIMIIQKHIVPPWAVTSLSLSGATPLSVYMDCIDLDGTQIDFVLSVLSQMHRIRSLTLNVYVGRTQSPNLALLKKCLELPALLLKKAEIKVGGLAWAFPPLRLFGDHAPKLNDLRLGCSLAGWRTSPLQHLTRLEVCISMSRHGKISLQDFFVILSMTEQLQILRVGCGHALFSGVAPHHMSRSIPLLHLSSLSLDVSWDACVAFFSVIAIPSETQVSLVTNPTSGLDREKSWDVLFTLMNKSFADGLSPQIDKAEVSLLTSFTYGNSKFKLWSKSKPLITVEFRSGSPMIFTSAQKIFPLDGLRSLSLCQEADEANRQSIDISFPPFLVVLLIDGPLVEWFQDYIKKNPCCLSNLEVLTLGLPKYWSRADFEAHIAVLHSALYAWRQRPSAQKLKELQIRCTGRRDFTAMQDLADTVSHIS